MFRKYYWKIILCVACSIPGIFKFFKNISKKCICFPGSLRTSFHNVKTKIWISWERKELLRWNKKHFFIIFIGLSLKQIKQIFFEGDSSTLTSAFYIGQKTDNITIKRIDNECQKKTFAEQIFLLSQLWHSFITIKHADGLSTSNSEKLIFDKARVTYRKKNMLDMFLTHLVYW